MSTLGGTQQVSIISESGLYALIMRSNKPQAKHFRKWVTSEVLPSIRRTGGCFSHYLAEDSHFQTFRCEAPVKAGYECRLSYSSKAFCL